MALLNAKLLFTLQFICSTLSAPQVPEINDQFTTTRRAVDEVKGGINEELNKFDNLTNITENTEVLKYVNQENEKPKEHRKYFTLHNELTDVDPKPSLLDNLYELLTRPINHFLSSSKVYFVLRNVGTCVVNGAMEIISYYFPAPLIPLIASAAGMVIPFEPVVMLKEKMPVTSYRRAFRKAMNSFLNTFDSYKFDSFDDDPYMTRRFNRRFMNDISGEKKKEMNIAD